MLQTYSNGDVVRWIEPSAVGPHPPPTVGVTAQGELLAGLAAPGRGRAQART